MVYRVGQRLEALKKSRRSLARDLGISEQAVSNWFNQGAGPSRKLIPVLATVLDTTTEYLLGLTDDPSRPEPRSEETAAPSQAGRPLWVDGLIAEVRQSGETAAAAILDQKEAFVTAVEDQRREYTETLKDMADVFRELKSELAGLRQELAAERAARARRWPSSGAGGASA